MAEPGSLVLENRRVHDGLDEQLLAVLCALTALDLDEADAAFARFVRSLIRHMRFEDEAVVPRFTALYEVHGDPRVKVPQHLDGDHRILERNLEMAAQALARLREEGGELRRRMVLELDDLLRLRRVLEHHDQRETRFCYPLLDAHLGSDDTRALLEGLVGTRPS